MSKINATMAAAFASMLVDETLSQVNNFGVVDYLVFLAMLLISTAIGVYFGFWAKGENTTLEYLQGGRRMKIIPIAMSLVASQMSCVGVITVPVEIYTFGINWCFAVIAIVVVIYILAWLIVPVLYENNFSNCYEYLEIRFNRATRQLITIIFLLNALFFMPLFIFLPSLALSQVSGINVHLINSVVGGICIFYTMIGGIKAVVWTDVVQGCIMLIAFVVIILIGIAKVGGFFEVFRLAEIGHRLDVNYTFDATTRTTIWNCLLHGIILWTTHLGLNQTCVQRIVSLSNLKDVKKTLVIFGFGSAIFLSFNIFIGFIVYAYYADCDPLSAGHIDKMDKLLPYYIQDVMGHLQGVSGLFIASVFSSSLSTVSAFLNSLAGVVYFDYIKPYIKHSEERANRIMKIMILFTGLLSIAAGVVVAQFTSTFRLVYAICGSTLGTIFGIYMMGVMMPSINGKAAFGSTIVSFVFMLIIVLGSLNQFHTPLPSSVNGCTDLNKTLSTNTSGYMLQMDASDASDASAFSVFNISPNWYAFLGCMLVFIVAIPLNYILPSHEDEKFDQKLLAPLRRSFIHYKKAPTNDVD